MGGGAGRTASQNYCYLLGFQSTAGPTTPGDTELRLTKSIVKSTKAPLDLIRGLQNSPRRHHRLPTSSQNHFSCNCDYMIQAKGGGHARGGGLSELPRPSVEDNIVSRAHTASHRTHERNETISRLGSPLNLRYTLAHME